MKFIHKELGIILDLSYINGTDFLSDLDGDLYLSDPITGTCEAISGKTAVESILRRGKPNDGYCPVCNDKCLKTHVRTFKRNA